MTVSEEYVNRIVKEEYTHLLNRVETQSRVEELAEGFWESGKTLDEYCIQCTNQLRESDDPLLATVNENAFTDFIKRQLVNLAQTALGALADIFGVGMGGIVVDLLFAGEAAISALSTFASLVGAARSGSVNESDELFESKFNAVTEDKELIFEEEGEQNMFSEMINGLLELDLKNGLDSMYDKVANIVQKVVKFLGKKAEKFLKKISKKIKKLLAKGATFVADLIASFIPADAGLSGVVIAEAIIAFASNAFSSIASFFSKVPQKLLSYIEQPEKLGELMKKAVAMMIDYIKGIGTGKGAKEEEEEVELEEGVFSTLTGMTPTGMAAKLVSRKAAPKMASWLEDKAPRAIEALVKATKLVLPFMLGGLALFQILMTGDYKSKVAEQKSLREWKDDELNRLMMKKFGLLNEA